jgi:hypothetical protein
MSYMERAIEAPPSKSTQAYIDDLLLALSSPGLDLMNDDARVIQKALIEYLGRLRDNKPVGSAQDNPDRYAIECPDCQHRHFLLVRTYGEIRFQCANCGANFIDDEGFGRP